MVEYKIVLSQSKVSSNKVDDQKLGDGFNGIQIRKGSSFWNITDDLQPIYNNFNLLSYFSSSCNISILDRHTQDSQSSYLSVDVFKYKNSQKIYLMVLKNRDELNKKFLPKLTTPAIVLYEVRQLKADLQSQSPFRRNKIQIESSQKLGQITVQFSTQIVKLQKQVFHYQDKKIKKQKQRELIWIKVIDKSGWINKNFPKIQLNQFRPRNLVSLKSKTNQVEYFYSQPKSQRYQKFNEDHISLALQGGGCKGVQYVGAYQAILQNNRINKVKIPIKSIIGSSAGSIIGLAICCELDPAEILQICSQTLCKVTRDQKHKSIPQKDSAMKRFFLSTIQALRDLNVFQDNIIQIFEKLLPDSEFQSKLLQIIKLATNDEIYKLFHDEKEKLNLEGLLNAELMSGDIIAEIGTICIQKLLIRLLNRRDKKFIDRYGYLLKIQSEVLRNQKILKTAMSFTMKQLYYLTEIQFTCTTVDINNHILRFLNQKTTPDLPVCKAVQMSGSFPVAFEAQKWQKSWGKYYIHYHSIRKQIDLTGCTLTDGGTLANFPMKYLDNQDMRPMYFSHVKTKSTLMYGFGLKTYIKLNQQQKQQTRQLKNKIKQLGELVIDKVGKCMPLCSWIKSKIGCYKPMQKTISNIQFHFQKIASIPLFNFAWKLLQTFSYSRDNLIQQCYTHRAFQTKITESYTKQLQNKPDHKQYALKVKRLSSELQNIFSKGMIQSKEKQIFQVFEKNIIYLIQQSQHRIYQVLNLYQIADMLLYNLNSFLKALFFNLGQTQRSSILNILKNIIRKKFSLQSQSQNLISLMFQEISNIKRQRIFKLCGIDEDSDYLAKAASVFYDFYNQIKNNYLQKLKESLKQIHKHQVEQIQQILQSVKSNYNIRQGCCQSTNFNSQYRNIVACLSKIFNLTNTIKIQDIKKAIWLIRKSEIPQLFVYFQSYQQKYTLQSYVTKQIMGYSKRQKIDHKQGPAKLQGLHIVLQSIFLSELYFHEYYMIVTETLLEYNSKMKLKLKDFQQVRVSTITSTSYHSIAMFLHASDLSQHRISKEILKIRDLVKIDIQKLILDFQKGNWAKITPLLLKQAQLQAIKNKNDIFQCIQMDLKQINQNQNDKANKIRSIIQKSLQKMEQQNQQMNEAIQSSLNHVVTLLTQLDQKILKQTNIDQIIKEKLMYSKQPQQNSHKVLSYSKRLKDICNFFFKKFKDIFQQIIYHYPLRADQIYKLLKPDQRKQVWKIVLLSEIVSGKNIKSYVKGILKDLKLKPNTTLKQFYDFSSKKIQLNFSVIDEEVVTILNHITRPNMPIWAAVLAATSTPQFFTPVLDRPEWRAKQQKNYQKRKVRSFFEKNKKPYRFITSSQLITRMPLDLLTNNKYKSQITDKMHEVFIVFNFNPQNIRLQKLKLQKDCVITPVTLGQLITKFVSFKSIIYKKFCHKQKKLQKQQRDQQQQEANNTSLKMLMNIPFVERKIRLLKLYIENHDNLMCELYKRQIILLPVRFDTLDFHKMNKILPNGKQVLSDICEDAIMQAKYIILQKMENRYFYQQQIKNNKSENQQNINILQSFKQQINKVIKVSKTSGKYIESKNQFGSKRKFYFRIQSFIQRIQENYDKLTDISYAYLSQRVICNLQSKIKLRFLSFLNPSRQLFQKFNIYYSTQHLRCSYKKVESQSLVVNQSHPQIYLKIEYPSSDLVTVNTSYFLLNFQEFFQLYNTQKISSQKKQIKGVNQFGYVYPLVFDYLYEGSSGVSVNPVGDAQQDYMNKNNNFVKKPKVYIKSQIKNTKNQQFFCPNCIIKLQPVKTFYAKSAFNCVQCRQNYDIKNYSLHYDNKKGTLCCLQGHILKRKEFNFKNFDSMTINQYVCDKCGEGSYKQFWKDDECDLSLCDKCTRESYCFQKQINLIDQ